MRKNKHQEVQLYVCRNHECGRTFTSRTIKTRHQYFADGEHPKSTSSGYAEGARMSEIKSKFDKAEMVVYLEQVASLVEGIDASLIEDLSSRYMQVRGKMLRLERAWQKSRQQI